MAKNKISAVRGMRDILPDGMAKHRIVSEVACEVSRLYGFQEIATPIVEYSEVFKRSLGASSDVVNKEMYVFPDRKGEELVLRPENTASIVRAFISNGLQESLPQRFFYNGAMFRYERPQSGRYRQFYQIGIEFLGNTSPYTDSEVIACGWHILCELGLGDRVVLQLNSLGDSESRAAYRVALSDYLQTHKALLSEDSQRRLDENPLRILDSKSPQDKEITSNAPKLADYFNADSREYFDKVCTLLEELKIPFKVNSHLVRGLDYYCHTVFEFVTDDLGAQGAVLAGGCYDGLVESMGGKAIGGVGWAAGIDRLALLIDEPKDKARVFAVIGIGDTAQKQLWRLAYILRKHGIAVISSTRVDAKKQMQDANKSGCDFALIIGDDELANKSVKLKDMGSGDEVLLLSPYVVSGLDLDKSLVNCLQEALKEFYGSVGR